MKLYTDGWYIIPLKLIPNTLKSNKENIIPKQCL